MKKQISVNKKSPIRETTKVRGCGDRYWFTYHRFNLSQFRKDNQDSPIKNESGVALVMVLLIVALASFIVIDLTHTSSLEVRSNIVAERGLRSEYYLKSAINLGRGLLMIKTTPGNSASPHEVWAQKFSTMSLVDNNLLGIQDRTVAISLQIEPLNTKIPLHAILNKKIPWMKALEKLFNDLGFADDNEIDQNYASILGESPILPAQMVVNLIDFMDADEDDFQDSKFNTATGIEGSKIPQGSFPNRPIFDVDELLAIPGFTQKRVGLIAEYVYAMDKSLGSPTSNININFLKTRPTLLTALDPGMTHSQTQEVLAYIDSGEQFTDANRTKVLKDDLGIDLPGINSLTTAYTKWFRITARVSYGRTSSFMKAFVYQESNTTFPEVRYRRIY